VENLDILTLKNLLDIDIVSLDEIGDGNLNFVYKLTSTQKTYALKHAKPYLKMLGVDFKLTQRRILAEMHSMEYFHSIAPKCTPKIYQKNEKEHFFVMEYLDGFQSLRLDFSNIQAYSHLGKFLYTLATNNPLKEDYYECEELKRITQNYVFEYPFIKGHKALVIEDYAPQKTFHKDFLQNKDMLKELFLHSKTSLIHGDFHTDSIMVKDANIAIIDSEFSLFCDISFDIGNLLAHTLFSSISFQNTLYQEKFLELFSKLKELKNFQDTLEHSIGFCAVEMARRLYVPAKSKDLENISWKKDAYTLSFEIANDLGSQRFCDIDGFLKRLEIYL
jgi:5-methylthioribose kinase